MSEPFVIICPTCNGTGCYHGNGAACKDCNVTGRITVVQVDERGTPSTGLTRDQMIEAAAKAIHAERCCPCDPNGCDYVDDLGWDQFVASRATDAVLRLLADDLEAEARMNQEIQRRSLRVPPEVVTLKGAGWPLAAARLRSLLPKGGDQ